MNQKSTKNDDVLSDIANLIFDFVEAIFGLVFLCFKWIYKKYFRKKPNVDKVELKHLKIKKVTEDESALGIDCQNRKALKTSDIDFTKHSFIIGASGFGKTNLMHLLQLNSAENDRPIVFIDPKGDRRAMNEFQALCSKALKPCYIFSEYEKSFTGINPVAFGSVNQIADRIIRAFEWTEPYYRDQAHITLMKAIKYLKDKRSPISLREIYDTIEEKFYSKDVAGLQAKLMAILESDFGERLGHDGKYIYFDELARRNGALYIGLSTQGYGETAMAIGKLILGDLLRYSYERLKRDDEYNAPFSVYFDEFGSVVTPSFIELLNKCRGAKMELTMAVQSMSDIDVVSPELSKQILENCCNIFVFKQRLDAHAGMLADAIGTQVTVKKTYQTEEGRRSNKGSEREVHEMIVHPDIIKNLNVGQCILLRHDPVRVHLLNVRKVPNLHEYCMIHRAGYRASYNGVL